MNYIFYNHVKSGLKLYINTSQSILNSSTLLIRDGPPQADFVSAVSVQRIQRWRMSVGCGPGVPCYPAIWSTRPGNLTVRYWKWPIEILDLPIQDGDFPVRELLVYQRVMSNEGNYKSWEYGVTSYNFCKRKPGEGLGHVFFLLLKLLYCKVTGFLLLGMGQVIRTVLVRIGQFTLLLNMARKGLIGCRCHVLICTSTDFFWGRWWYTAMGFPTFFGTPILYLLGGCRTCWRLDIFFWYLTWCQIPICLHGVKPLTSINMH